MRGPKHEGDYPDREIDCEEAVSEGVTRLVEEGVRVDGPFASEAEAAAAMAKSLPDAPSMGNRSLLEEAVKAGWGKDETLAAMKKVAIGLNLGYSGTDINE